MGKNVFSVPIFFIVFRETLEAAIIVSVLLGLVEQIVHTPSTLPPSPGTSDRGSTSDVKVKEGEGAVVEENVDDPERNRVLVKKLRWQVILSLSQRVFGF